MQAAEAQAQYRGALDQTVTIRRYSGTGSTRTHADYNARARVTGYAPEALVGNVIQGDRRAIVYSADLDGVGFTQPVTNDDKLVVRGKELQIVAVDDSTRRVDDVLIAYELQVRG
jgi:hypothetical protein